MSGMLITVIPPTLFDFASLAINSTMSFVVGSRIDTSGVEAGVLQVRVHTVNIQNAADSITVNVSTHGYTPDDPGSDFGGVGATMATSPILGQSVAPQFITNPLLANFGGLVKVTVQPSRAGLTGSLQAKLSIDLVFKMSAPARAAAVRSPGTYLGYL